MDDGVAACSRVENLKLALARWWEIELYDDDVYGLNRLLESMTTLKRFWLVLPDDFVNQPAIYFSYTTIFPKKGH